MNPSNTNTTTGSESSNTMPVLNTKGAQLNTLRKAIAGAHYMQVFIDESLGAVVFLHVADNGVAYQVGFSGKREKPDFRYRFRSIERESQYQDEWHKGLISRAAAKAERRAEKAAKMAGPHQLIVGDVLVASWGYDQTNYDYYQVTRLVGRQSVEIRELKQQADERGFLQGDCVPVKGAFKGEPMIKRVTEYGTVKVFSWGVYASKKEPVTVGGVDIFRPDHYTAYA